MMRELRGWTGGREERSGAWVLVSGERGDGRRREICCRSLCWYESRAFSSARAPASSRVFFLCGTLGAMCDNVERGLGMGCVGAREGCEAQEGGARDEEQQVCPSMERGAARRNRPRNGGATQWSLLLLLLLLLCGLLERGGFRGLKRVERATRAVECKRCKRGGTTAPLRAVWRAGASIERTRKKNRKKTKEILTSLSRNQISPNSLITHHTHPAAASS
jgi:hypothetical protein